MLIYNEDSFDTIEVEYSYIRPLEMAAYVENSRENIDTMKTQQW